MEELYHVYRLDHDDNEFLMPYAPMPKQEALDLVKMYEDRGHHQTYEAKRVKPVNVSENLKRDN